MSAVSIEGIWQNNLIYILRLDIMLLDVLAVWITDMRSRGSKLYSDQKLTFNEKRTNIKTIVYTLEWESYLPTVSIYQPLMCPHTRF